MASPALSDERGVEGSLDALIKKLLHAKSSPDAKKALLEARRLKGIAQKWGAIPPQPDAKRELLAKVTELMELADQLDVDPDKVGKEPPPSASLDSIAHVSRSGAHAIPIASHKAPTTEPPIGMRTPLHDEKTSPDGAILRAAVLKGLSIQDEPTTPHGRASKGQKPSSVHDEKTAPGRRFPSIHDEKTAPDGALPPAAAFRTQPPNDGFDDEPTNPSALSGDESEEPAPASSSPSRGSRARERRAIARGKGAMLVARSPAPGLNMESVMNGAWTPFADRAAHRVLARDSGERRCVALLKLEAKANLPASHTAGPAELTVITGTAFVSGSELNAGETCTIAEGTPRPAIASQEGAVLLYAGSDADECLRPSA